MQVQPLQHRRMAAAVSQGSHLQRQLARLGSMEPSFRPASSTASAAASEQLQQTHSLPPPASAAASAPAPTTAPAAAFKPSQQQAPTVPAYRAAAQHSASGRTAVAAHAHAAPPAHTRRAAAPLAPPFWAGAPVQQPASTQHTQLAPPFWAGASVQREASTRPSQATSSSGHAGPHRSLGSSLDMQSRVVQVRACTRLASSCERPCCSSASSWALTDLPACVCCTLDSSFQQSEVPWLASCGGSCVTLCTVPAPISDNSLWLGAGVPGRLPGLQAGAHSVGQGQAAHDRQVHGRTGRLRRPLHCCEPIF